RRAVLPPQEQARTARLVIDAQGSAGCAVDPNPSRKGEKCAGQMAACAKLHSCCKILNRQTLAPKGPLGLLPAPRPQATTDWSLFFLLVAKVEQHHLLH